MLWLLWSGAQNARRRPERIVLDEEFERPGSQFQPAAGVAGRFEGGAIVLYSRGGSPARVVAEGLDLNAGPFDRLRVALSSEGDFSIRMRALVRRRGSTAWETIEEGAMPMAPVVRAFTIRLSRYEAWRGRVEAIAVEFESQARSEIRIDGIGIVRDAEGYSGDGTARRIAHRALYGVARLRWAAVGLWLSIAGASIVAPPRRGWAIAAWIFALALLPRLLFASVPLLDYQAPERTGEWLAAARAFRSGAPSIPPDGGLLWAAMSAWAAGDDAVAAFGRLRAMQSVIGALTAVVVFLIARGFMNRRSALGAALLHAIAREAVRSAGFAPGDPIFALSLATTAWLALRLGRARGSRFDAWALAAAFASMVALRPAAIALLPVYPVFILLRRGRDAAIRRTPPLLAAAAIGFVSLAFLAGSADRFAAALHPAFGAESGAAPPVRALVEVFSPRRMDHWFDCANFPIPLAPFGALMVVGALAALFDRRSWRRHALFAMLAAGAVGVALWTGAGRRGAIGLAWIPPIYVAALPAKLHRRFKRRLKLLQEPKSAPAAARSGRRRRGRS